jgi:hypothetical protein
VSDHVLTILGIYINRLPTIVQGTVVENNRKDLNATSNTTSVKSLLRAIDEVKIWSNRHVVVSGPW